MVQDARREKREGAQHTAVAVELIFDSTCPNVEAAREQIRAALRAMGAPPTWQEWQRDAPGAPPHVRQYGSPTVLVGGVDVSPTAGQQGDCCRVYAGPTGLRGVPAWEEIVRALKH